MFLIALIAAGTVLLAARQNPTDSVAAGEAVLFGKATIGTLYKRLPTGNPSAQRGYNEIDY
jgi:hypothetical protein